MMHLALFLLSLNSDVGCQIDPPLPPPAAHRVELQRARLGASDPGGDIVLGCETYHPRLDGSIVTVCDGAVVKVTMVEQFNGKDVR